jgi:hypothetical protein
MASNLVFYQLLLVALACLCFVLHARRCFRGVDPQLARIIHQPKN